MKQPVRWTRFPLIALGLLGVVATPVASQGRITKTCLTGNDPSVANDATQITTVRGLVDAACPCANYDGSKGKTHAAYLKCVAPVINGEVPSGLRMQCKRTVKAYYAKSTCGKNPTLQFEPCVSKGIKSGKVHCAIMPTKKKNGTPSPACSTTAKATRVVCSAYTTCIDAADDNHDLLIAAPGDTGACACPGATTECAGVCVDESTDSSNCGTCGNVCGGGQVCSSGSCVCPGATTECGGVCVNESTDSNNCGSCGHVCGGGQVCRSASCVTLSYVFISSLTYDGNLGGLTGADAKCQALAGAAGLAGTYKAWLSDSVASAGSRLTAGTNPYALVDGTIVANNFTDLTDGTLAAPINETESGAFLNDRAWTGTAPNGTTCYRGNGGNCTLTSPTADDNGLARTTCSDWTSNVFGGESVTGVNATNGTWTLEGDRDCADQHYLYCIQQ